MATKKTITKVRPLDISFTKEINQLEKQIEKLTDSASKRHIFIVSKIVNIFNFKKVKVFNSNHFYDLDSLSNLEDDVICHGFNTVDDKTITFQVGEESFPLCEYYPTRWLFENFEQELESIKKEVDNKTLAAKKQQQENKKMLTSLKKKLTAEELAFLKDKI